MGYLFMAALMGTVIMGTMGTISFLKFVLIVFSRKIIWLKLASSNRNPTAICRYYLESVEEAGGIIMS